MGISLETSTDDRRFLLVLGAAPRCGTTLIQRLVSSHSQAFIWGEPAIGLRSLLRGFDHLIERARTVGQTSAEEYARRGYHAFMSGLQPEIRLIHRVAGETLAALYRRAPEVRDLRVWGFKEVSIDLRDCYKLADLMPTTMVVFVTRDPIDVAKSLHGWEQQVVSDWNPDLTVSALRRWAKVSEQFLGPLDDLPFRHLCVRYEDMIADPSTFITALASMTELDPSGFDDEVFRRRVNDIQPALSQMNDAPGFDDLNERVRETLRSDALVRVASLFGYQCLQRA